MFSTISWGTYWESVIALAVTYYLVIISLFYRREVLQIFIKAFSISREAGNRQILKETPVFTTDEVDNARQDNASVFLTVEALTNRLRTLFNDAEKRKLVKEELMMVLQSVLREHLSLKDTAFQVAINNQVEQLAMHSCNLELEPNDLTIIWNG